MKMWMWQELPNSQLQSTWVQEAQNPYVEKILTDP